MQEKERVLLINPPSPFLMDERVFPNIAPLYVANAFKREGKEVKVLDLSGEKDYVSKAQDSAIGYNHIGITSTSPQFMHASEILRGLRKSNPLARVIIGGPHASVVSNLRRAYINQGLEHQLNELDPNFRPLEQFDTIIEGEGENQVNDLFSDGVKWKNVGIAEDFADLPFPDRGMINLPSYKYTIDGKKATNIMTQRGCPFGCYFCCGRDLAQYRQVKVNGKQRILSPEKILEEMDDLNQRFGIEGFMWFDDEVNIHNNRLEELVKVLSKRDYVHRGFVKSELMVKNPEQASMLRDIGFVEICTGMESGSDRILRDYVKKNTTSYTNSKARELAKEKGMRFKAFSMVGHPTETHEDIIETKQWFLDNKPDDFDLTIHQPYPGAPVYDKAERSEQFEGFNWTYQNGLFFNKVDYSKEASFYKGIPGEYVSNVRTNELSEKDLVRLRDEVERDVRKQLNIPNNSVKHEVSYGGQK